MATTTNLDQYVEHLPKLCLLLVSVFLQLGVELCPAPTSFHQMACLPLPTNFHQQYVHQGWRRGGFLLHRCKTLSYVLYHSWLFWGKEEPAEVSRLPLPLQLVSQPVTYWAVHLKALLELNLCLSTKVTSQVSIWTLGTPLCCWLQPGHAFSGGADTANHVAVWPSGHSLVRRGHGSGEALWAVACNPILVGKQNCHSRSYPVFRAHEADGPSR